MFDASKQIKKRDEYRIIRSMSFFLMFCSEDPFYIFFAFAAAETNGRQPHDITTSHPRCVEVVNETKTQYKRFSTRWSSDQCFGTFYPHTKLFSTADE